jgi:uncharacterized protein YndB with AHSA1/START domain
MNDGPFADFIDDDLGEVIERRDGRYDLIMRRRINKPLEKVWAALTVPERIADWLGNLELELRVGGRYCLKFEGEDYQVDGVIVELDPPRLLAHTWPGPQDEPPAIVRYQLEPDGDGCRLVLANEGVPAQYAASIAGWHVFLEALPGAVEGIRTKWTMDRELEIGKRYAHLLPQRPENTGA